MEKRFKRFNCPNPICGTFNLFALAIFLAVFGLFQALNSQKSILACTTQPREAREIAKKDSPEAVKNFVFVTMHSSASPFFSPSLPNLSAMDQFSKSINYIS